MEIARNVRSSVYFEQMKGRGIRTISPAEFQSVTKDADCKTHFVIVDAVGVCENDRTDSKPLERKKSIPFDKLILSIAMGNRDEDVISSLAGRLARLDRKLNDNNRREIEDASGSTLKQLVNGLLDAIDADKRVEKTRELFKTENPTLEQLEQAVETLAKRACTPFQDETLRNLLVYMRKQGEMIIDTIS